MKRMVEKVFMSLFFVAIVAVSAGLFFGFYYLIFVLATKVFFG